MHQVSLQIVEVALDFLIVSDANRLTKLQLIEDFPKCHVILATSYFLCKWSFRLTTAISIGKSAEYSFLR